MVISVALSVLGTSIGISILPQIEVWASKVRAIEVENCEENSLKNL